MKKIIIFITIFFSLFSIVRAGEEKTEESKDSSNTIKVTVTTKIPGANCSPKKLGEDNKTVYYECNISKSTYGIVKMLGEMIKWLTFFTSIVSVLAIVISGIMYTMGGADEELKNQAKNWIKRIILGFIILFSSGYILQLIAPWVYK